MKQEGKNNEYDLLVSQQVKEEKLRNEAFEKLKKLRKKEAAIQLAQQTASLITASAKIFEGTASDPITLAIAIGTIASMIAAFIGYKNKIKAISDEEPGFAKGVIGYKGKGTEKSDSNRVRISHNESIITAEGTKNAPKALEMINKGKITDQEIMMAYSLSNLGLFQKGTDSTIKLWKEMKENKEATIDLLNYHKYEEAKIQFLKNGIIRIKKGRTIIDTKII